MASNRAEIIANAPSRTISNQGYQIPLARRRAKTLQDMNSGTQDIQILSLLEFWNFAHEFWILGDSDDWKNVSHQRAKVVILDRRAGGGEYAHEFGNLTSTSGGCGSEGVKKELSHLQISFPNVLRWDSKSCVLIHGAVLITWPGCVQYPARPGPVHP